MAADKGVAQPGVDAWPKSDEFQGQPAIRLRTPGGDCATVLPYGAHVVSWIPAGGIERLYLSELSDYGDGQAIRGGVPVVFPQFNQRGPDFSLPRHGFARTRNWEVLQAGVGEAVLQLADDPQTRTLWPHRFMTTMTVSLGPQRLDLELRVRNTDDEALEFTAALHTYLRVGDIRKAGVFGLQGVRYLDTVANQQDVGSSAPLRFDRETDRIYFDVLAPLRLQAPIGSLQVAMEGFSDSVIWNPWAERCARLPDMPDDDFRRMLCIEAAAIGRPVRLEPAAQWLGRQTLTAATA